MNDLLQEMVEKNVLNEKQRKILELYFFSGEEATVNWIALQYHVASSTIHKYLRLMKIVLLYPRNEVYIDLLKKYALSEPETRQKKRLYSWLSKKEVVQVRD